MSGPSGPLLLAAALRRNASEFGDSPAIRNDQPMPGDDSRLYAPSEAPPAVVFEVMPRVAAPPPPHPAATTPSQNSNKSTNDAFAQTMGSGDHGVSPVVTVDVPPPVITNAPTIDSTSTAPVPAPVDVASASTVMQSANQPVVNCSSISKPSVR